MPDGQDTWAALLTDAVPFRLVPSEFSITPHAPQTGGPVPSVVLEPNLVVPQSFTATTQRDGFEVMLEVVVDDWGDPHCRGVAIRNGEDVTGETLRRLPVAQLVKEAVAWAAQHEWFEQLAEPVPMKGGRSIVGMGARSSMSSDERASFYGRYAKNARQPRRGSPLTDENLTEVAELYREAVKRGDPPTKVICRTWHVERSTASRWVAAARDRGFLGPAKRGRAGEAS